MKPSICRLWDWTSIKIASYSVGFESWTLKCIFLGQWIFKYFISHAPSTPPPNTSIQLLSNVKLTFFISFSSIFLLKASHDECKKRISFNEVMIMWCTLYTNCSFTLCALFLYFSSPFFISRNDFSVFTYILNVG